MDHSHERLLAGLPVTERQVELAGVSTVVLEGGDGPPLMLLHGGIECGGPLPRGASQADVERAFPEWEITDVVTADTEPDALARLFKFDEVFFRLRRR